jgi:hypothetical protein
MQTAVIVDVVHITADIAIWRTLSFLSTGNQHPTKTVRWEEKPKKRWAQKWAQWAQSGGENLL